MIEGLPEFISDSLGVPTDVYNAMRRIKVKEESYEQADLNQISPLLTEALGLALRRKGE